MPESLQDVVDRRLSNLRQDSHHGPLWYADLKSRAGSLGNRPFRISMCALNRDGLFLLVVWRTANGLKKKTRHASRLDES